MKCTDIHFPHDILKESSSSNAIHTRGGTQSQPIMQSQLQKEKPVESHLSNSCAFLTLAAPQINISATVDGVAMESAVQSDK